jgi:hypothetical protein
MSRKAKTIQGIYAGRFDRKAFVAACAESGVDPTDENYKRWIDVIDRLQEADPDIGLTSLAGPTGLSGSAGAYQYGLTSVTGSPLGLTGAIGPTSLPIFPATTTPQVRVGLTATDLANVLASATKDDEVTMTISVNGKVYSARTRAELAIALLRIAARGFFR